MGKRVHRGDAGGADTFRIRSQQIARQRRPVERNLQPLPRRKLGQRCEFVQSEEQILGGKEEGLDEMARTAEAGVQTGKERFLRLSSYRL